MTRVFFFFVSMIVLLRKQKGNLGGRKEASMEPGTFLEIFRSVR